MELNYFLPALELKPLTSIIGNAVYLSNVDILIKNLIGFLVKPKLC